MTSTPLAVRDVSPGTVPDAVFLTSPLTSPPAPTESSGLTDALHPAPDAPRVRLDGPGVSPCPVEQARPLPAPHFRPAVDVAPGDAAPWEIADAVPAESSPAASATADGLSSPAATDDAVADDVDELEVPQPADEPSEVQGAGGVAVRVFASGMNGALQRAPKVRCTAHPMVALPQVATTRWRPQWDAVKTIRLTFPAGEEFLPPPSPKRTTGNSAPGSNTLENLRSLLPPGAPPANPGDPAAATPDASTKTQHTRIKPPADALSIEDRLFYLLQPPLETWLKGQELIMPFEPFHYQYEGIAWLFSQTGALLADEMGLGKTMQTITAIRLLMRAGQARRILLVCPKQLIPNWQREFKMWADELPVVTLEGEGPRRQMLWTLPGATILLANYELLVRDWANFAEAPPPPFDLVILDEAQRIKNRDSRTAVTARAIPRRRSWALTGTPIENRPEELASLYEFMEVVPPRATPDLRQLTLLAKQYILRRTKDLVMTDMPPRLDRDAVLDLAPAQRLAYDTAENEGVIRLNDMGEAITIQHVFELVLRLKQITNYDPLTGESSKLERLEADLEEIAECGEKAILFSQWTGTIDWLETRLARFNPLAYHGRIPTPKREPILAQFKSDPKAHLLLMSYATGAVGLNLQFAHYVFLFDRWWNPAVEDQAINRAHRIGVTKPVIVTRFISKDTIEERIDRVLQEKRALFAAVLGDGEATNRSLSLNASEIFGLFDLKARHGKETRSIGPAAPVG